MFQWCWKLDLLCKQIRGLVDLSLDWIHSSHDPGDKSHSQPQADHGAEVLASPIEKIENLYFLRSLL